MKSLLFAFFVLAGVTLQAQTDATPLPTEEPNIDPEVYSVIQHMPEFGDTTRTFRQYINSEIQYPQKAKESRQQGTVWISYIVETDGSISNVLVNKSVSPELDREAVRVVSNSPKWKPGMVDGQPVRVQMYMEVTFVLN